VKTGVLSSTTAYLVTDALMDVVNRGTAARVRQMGYRGAVAGKTGTSRDAWFVGYTPNLLVVVWVGNDDNEDLRMTGGEAAVPIWTDFLKRISQLRPDLVAGKFEAPAGMEMVRLCATSGGLADEYCAKQQSMLLPQSMIPPPCNEHLPPQQPFGEDTMNAFFTEGQRLDEPVQLPTPVKAIQAQVPDAVRAELERMNWTIPDK
jgi:penicillin-binding protein 1B